MTKQLGKRAAWIALIAVSGLFFLFALLTGVLERTSGDRVCSLFGSRFAAVEITADPDYPRGSLVRLQQGSIPENTPVAVYADGVLVLSDSRLSDSEVGGKVISREQILGSVDLQIPGAGWLFILTGTDIGWILSLVFSFLFCAAGTIGLVRVRGEAAETPDPVIENSDPFPELDYKLGSRPAVSESFDVKTLVITQTRAASSAIRSQKGEVRIYASGQEKVLPLNIGRRVVTIGGYMITVDITKAPERTTEDITKELPVIRSGSTGASSAQQTSPEDRQEDHQKDRQEKERTEDSEE